MKHGKRRLNANAKGRSERREQFWMLTFKMARSPAFRSLSGAAVKVLTELRCRFNGQNATQLHLSYGEAATLLGLSKTTVHRAFNELKAKGFVQLTRQGMRYARLASEWTVTDLPTKPGEPPSNDWRRWQAPPEKQNIGTPAAPKRPGGSAAVPVAVQRSVTIPKAEQQSAPDGSVSVPPIHSTMRSDAAKPPASEAAERAWQDGVSQFLAKARI